MYIKCYICTKILLQTRSNRLTFKVCFSPMMIRDRITVNKGIVAFTEKKKNIYISKLLKGLQSVHNLIRCFYIFIGNF